MAENKPISATLELVYVPDTYTETERQEGASWPLGSGFYDLVAVAGDARLPLHRFKAGAVDKLFALAKERKEAEAKQSETTAPPAQPTPTQEHTTTTGEPPASPPPEQPPPQ